MRGELPDPGHDNVDQAPAQEGADAPDGSAMTFITQSPSMKGDADARQETPPPRHTPYRFRRIGGLPISDQTDFVNYVRRGPAYRNRPSLKEEGKSDS